jgi:hypothetical protein
MEEQFTELENEILHNSNKYGQVRLTAQHKTFEELYMVGENWYYNIQTSSFVHPDQIVKYIKQLEKKKKAGLIVKKKQPTETSDDNVSREYSWFSFTVMHLDQYKLPLIMQKIFVIMFYLDPYGDICNDYVLFNENINNFIPEVDRVTEEQYGDLVIRYNEIKYEIFPEKKPQPVQKTLKPKAKTRKKPKAK